MEFTPLHRYLGRGPGPLESEMIDEAITKALRETGDLDWKSQAAERLSDSDYPKDVAAMANSGGGMIVFGVTDEQKAATGRKHVQWSENLERQLRAVAGAKVSPPVLNLRVVQIESPGGTADALAVIVPASAESPHFIFNNQFVGAPYRNDSDTAWMSESQIAAAYRARFEGSRAAADELDRIYRSASVRAKGRPEAWIVAAARPRVPHPPAGRLTSQDAQLTCSRALTLSKAMRTDSWSALSRVNTGGIRSALRGKVLPPLFPNSEKDAWLNLLDDGSVAIAQRVGGIPGRGLDAAATITQAWILEATVCDLMAALHVTASRRNWGDVDVSIGIQWGAPEPLLIYSESYDYLTAEWSVEVPEFQTVRSTVTLDGDLDRLLVDTRELALDVISQGGLSALVSIREALS